ncbi:MAG: ABC transporter substrate-binding protein [Lachnospiraceae bacterium]
MRKGMKKALAAGLSLTMALGLAACGGGSSNGGSSNGGGSSKGGELKVAIWDTNQQKGLDEIIKDFTAETGIKASIQVLDWNSYWTLLEAGATGGDMPDVFWMHSNEAVKYMSNDILLDITDRVNSSEKLEMDKFPQDLKDMYTYDGKIYAIPKDMDTIAMWYNKTMFDEAGLDYPTADWTWDDFYEIAKKLTKDDGSQYGFAMNPSNEQDTWMNIVYTMGGTILKEDGTSGFDDPQTIKAMEFVDKLVKDVCPPANTMSETGTDVLFQSGKVAMISQGSWMVAGFKENEYLTQNCDVVRLPKDKATGKSVSIYNGLGWSISAGTSMPDEAYQLIEWFGTKDMQKKQAELGVTMAAYEGMSEPWVKNTDVFNLQPYLDAMDTIQFRPHTNATLDWWNPMVEELKKPWSGEESMADACKNITTEMNEHIAEEQQ